MTHSPLSVDLIKRVSPLKYLAVEMVLPGNSTWTCIYSHSLASRMPACVTSQAGLGIFFLPEPLCLLP